MATTTSAGCPSSPSAICWTPATCRRTATAPRRRRYTEASLVKALEERGIGRPSTYAATISVIVDRGYVTSKGSALVPTWLAFAVTRLLEEHFGKLVDYDFTASMEEDLDRIANGEEQRVDWLTKFYFGDGTDGGRWAGGRACSAWSRTWARSTPGISTRCRSARASSCGSAGTGRTWR